MWQNQQNEEQATPRTAQVDSITDTLAQFQVSSTYDEAALGGEDGYNLTTAQTAESGGETKGKAVYYGAADDDGAAGGFGGGSGEGSGGDGGGTWPADPLQGRNHIDAGAPHDQDALPDQEYTADCRYDENPELEHALAASLGPYPEPKELGYGAYSQAQAGSSSGQYVDNSEYPNAAEGGSLTTQIATNMTSVPDITGTPGGEEPVDSRFRVQSSNMFQPGNVFKILWADPKGQGRGRQQARLGDFTEKTQLPNAYGEEFYVTFRRFIIVANDQGHATCVPIYTYLQQGCTKPGIKPEKHGIIHEVGTEARLLPNEGSLGVRPIRLQIDHLVSMSGEKLHMASRVNYSKLTTIEHNVKVFFLGSIVQPDFDNIVRPAINKCWEQKTHERHHAQHHERRQERPNKQRNKRR